MSLFFLSSKIQKMQLNLHLVLILQLILIQVYLAKKVSNLSAVKPDKSQQIDF